MWGKWAQGSMRVRYFETRSAMIATLLQMGLISTTDAESLESITFEDSCPLFSGNVSDEALLEHGFYPPSV
jgi:hypothetical protein